MRTKDIKKIILTMFGNEKFYGYEAHKKLMSKDVEIEISRLYRILNDMLKEGLLDCSWTKSRLGPRKRVYRIGSKGKTDLEKILLDAIKTVHSFYGNYLMDLPPKSNVFNRINSLLTHGLKGRINIAYITTKYSVMHERMLHALQSKAPQGKIYFIKPDSMEMDLKIDNLSILDGTYNNILLKKNFTDLLVVTGVPKKNSLESALKEWKRVLKQHGKLTILIPTILIKKYEDPLTIGDFIEKYENKTSEKEKEQISKEYIQKKLKMFFNKIEERQVVHITIFLASEPHSLQP